MKKLVMEALVLVMVFVSHPVLAGSLDAPAAPTDAGSAMYTLEDVYNRIDDGTTGTKRSGEFTEPGAAPGSTGHTLTELYDLASERSRPAKTGQTICYAADGIVISPCTGTGQDGDEPKGVTWPSPRFTCYNTDKVEVDCSTGFPVVVTDNLTGLMWAQDANLANGTKLWADALAYCNGLTLGGHTDWRLPNVKELFSLIDFAFFEPALSDDEGTVKWSEGDAFTGVQSNVYWSSTTYALLPSRAWFVHMLNGYVYFDYKDKDYNRYYYVWPVRSGS